jgi:hypothetical protein
MRKCGGAALGWSNHTVREDNVGLSASRIHVTHFLLCTLVLKIACNVRSLGKSDLKDEIKDKCASSGCTYYATIEYAANACAAA